MNGRACQTRRHSHCNGDQHGMNCFGQKKELQVSLLRTTGFEVSDLYICIPICIHIYIYIFKNLKSLPPSLQRIQAQTLRPPDLTPVPLKGHRHQREPRSLHPPARSALRSRLIELGVVHQQLLQEGDLPALDGLSSAPQRRTSAPPAHSARTGRRKKGDAAPRSAFRVRSVRYKGVFF